MISEYGAVCTAHKLISKATASEGLVTLLEYSSLDLSLVYLVLKP